MNRRQVISGLAAAALPHFDRAQAQGKKIPIIGFLNNGAENIYSRHVAAFKAGLAEEGYQDGRDVLIEYRWAAGRDDRLAALAGELVNKGAVVLAATGGTVTAQAAKATAGSVPVVFVIGGDPLKQGLVEALARPGGTVTGASFLANELLPKQLEVIHEIRPEPRGIACLINPANPNVDTDVSGLEAAATALGRPLFMLPTRTPEDIDRAFASCPAADIGAVLIFPDALFSIQADRLAAIALRCRLPSLYNRREFADAGGLISYGTDQIESYRHAGRYVGRVLAGAKPAALPVVLPTRYELVVNLKTARALGIAIPSSLLARADELIE